MQRPPVQTIMMPAKEEHQPVPAIYDVRQHCDVKPEVCPYCKKECHDQRPLDKDIRAIHEADRPFACEHCTESFRGGVIIKKRENCGLFPK